MLVRGQDLKLGHPPATCPETGRLSATDFNVSVCQMKKWAEAISEAPSTLDILWFHAFVAEGALTRAWQEKQCREVKGSLRALRPWAVSLGDGRTDKSWLALEDGVHLLQSSASYQPCFSAHPGRKQKEGGGCHFCRHHHHGPTTT